MLKEKLAPYPQSVFLTDNAVVFPSRAVRKAENTIYFFEPIADTTWDKVDFVVLAKNSVVWRQLENGESEPYHYSPLGAGLLRAAVLNEPPFEVFYEDASMRASRRIRNK
jgi:hypothetical protein